MELDVVGDVCDRLLGRVKVRQPRGATTPTHGQHTLITSLIGARIKPIGVATSVSSEDFEGVVAAQGEDVHVVLQQGYCLTSHLANGSFVIPLDINELVDNTTGGEESSRIERTLLVLGVGGEVWQGIVLVLSELVPCGNNTGDLFCVRSDSSIEQGELTMSFRRLTGTLPFSTDRESSGPQ